MKSTFKSALNNTALAAFASVTLLGSTPVSTAAVFAKYDGVDGESADANHDKWIDVLSVSWGMHRPVIATGDTRRRGVVVLQDLTITALLDKSSPKLMESCVTGEMIPKLEIETTANYGGSRATYFTYELTNVQVTSYRVKPTEAEDARPTVEMSLNFEEIKVTYTEIDDAGNSKGKVEYSWKVEEGEG